MTHWDITIDVVLSREWISQAQIVLGHLAEAILPRRCCHALLSRHLVHHFVVFVVWSLFLRHLERLPVRGHFKKAIYKVSHTFLNKQARFFTYIP